MHYWPVLFSLLFSFTLFARTIESEIHDIDHGDGLSPTLLFLNSGEVIKLKPGQDKSHDLLLGQRIRFKVNKKRFVESWERVSSMKSLNQEVALTAEDYEPTILSSHKDAQTIFKKLNQRWRWFSECYNRAHIWAYESHKRFDLKSMKVFLFFTRKYIREYDFGWWFHVSPFTFVKENDVVQEKVLDYMFLKRPSDMRSWSNYFMKNDAYCPTIEKFSDYQRGENKAYCYLYKTSMYFYQPLDLERLERSGQSKEEWLKWEVRNAYRQGFRW